MDENILIVGAGLSGLTAAALLAEGGAGVRVVEAADRIGGRIGVLRDEDGGTLGDLGPTWVWPAYQPVVARWIERLGLATYPQHDAGDAVVEAGPGMAPRRQRVPGQDAMARIVGGPQAFVEAMAARLPDEACETGRAVERIERTAEGVRATCATGEIYEADRVVLAMPLRVSDEQIAFDPPLSAALTAALAGTPTWMAQQGKALIVYERAFWRETGLSGRIASATGPLAEAHDHCGADGTAALFGFVGWPPERRGEGSTEAIRAQLARCFGPEAASPLRIHVEDWARNPHICARRDLAEPPRHPMRAPDVLREGHWEDRLHFVVAETALRSPGLIEGALDAGGRIAADLLARPVRSA